MQHHCERGCLSKKKHFFSLLQHFKAAELVNLLHSLGNLDFAPSEGFLLHFTRCMEARVEQCNPQGAPLASLVPFAGEVRGLCVPHHVIGRLIFA
jgi:hypothetical protein